MAKAKKTVEKAKVLRYVLRTIVDLEPADAGDITDLIDRNNELGTCVIEDVLLVEVEKE